VLTALVGIAVPFFGGLLGFFGGFAFAPTTYYVRDHLSFRIQHLVFFISAHPNS
jgi:hypothetical protein